MSDPVKKIIVTGGCGFIGSCLVRYLINHTSYVVINIDKLTYAGSLDTVASVANAHRYLFYENDICDRASVDKIFQMHRPVAVIHLAAESHVDRSIDGPAEFIHTNILGTYTLLEATRKYLAELDNDEVRRHFRFHHVSTDEVFGSLGEDWLFNEI